MSYVHSPLFRFQVLLQVLFVAFFYFFNFTNHAQALLGGVLLCSVGIPHGANDHLYRPDATLLGLVKFLGVYLGSMGVYLAIWWLAPVAALLLFFIISFHHFGQSNFESPAVWYAPALLWGGWGLVFPVLLHWNEAMGIFGKMVDDKVNWQTFDVPETWRYAIMVSWAVLYLFSIWYSERKQGLYYALQWVLITVWFAITPLLFGFIVVFCLWHSLQSLQHQLQYFQKSNGGSERQFFLALLPFGLLALVGFGVYVYFRGFDIAEAFILLSLITLPHVAVMHRLYNTV